MITYAELTDEHTFQGVTFPQGTVFTYQFKSDSGNVLPFVNISNETSSFTGFYDLSGVLFEVVQTYDNID